MPSNEGDGQSEYQRQLWSALDLVAHALAFHIVVEEKNGRSLPGPAALYLEATRIIALEGLDSEEAHGLALERVGTSREQVVRWAREFLSAREARMSRDHFIDSDADTLAEIWGHHKGRFPDTLEDLEELVRKLREIIERSSDDPERRELLDIVPGGSAKEVREVLSRRRSP